jgi:hypothetical protein
VTNNVRSSKGEIDAVSQLAKAKAAAQPGSRPMIIALNEASLKSIQMNLTSLQLPENERFQTSDFCTFEDYIPTPDRKSVILSISFSKSSSNSLHENFESLNGPGGYFAFLEFLEKLAGISDLLVVTSIRVLDFDNLPAFEAQDGRKLLRRFLQYCEQNYNQDKQTESLKQLYARYEPNNEVQKLTLANFDSLQDLQNNLLQNGISAQIDFSIDNNFCIPFLIQNAEQTEFSKHPKIALITDNDAYIEEPSARMRNRLVLQYLERAGYLVFPLWSVKLFLEPARAAESLIEVAKQII